MTMVLVHGGGFDHRCWDPMVPFLDGDVVAVDLPGRGDTPPPFDERDPDAVPDWTIADYAQSVVDVIEAKGLDDVVLVGHSMAGVTLPVVAARIPERLSRLVFVSASVPPHGASVADVLGTLSPAAAEIAARMDTESVTEDGKLHPDLARAMFCNDMTEAQVSFTLERMVQERFAVVTEPVDLSGLDHPIPRTYIRLLRDQSLTLDSQDQMIESLGGAEVVEVVDLDASHMAMIAAPEVLAAVLNRYL